MKSILEYINESEKKYDNFLNLPPITELDDGEYNGALWGHCFAYDGKQYFSEIGIKNIYPIYYKIVVKDGKIFEIDQMDKYQRQELKKLFED